MIKNIQKLENFGIFSDYYKTSETDDFARYNLIFGWNGTGKSTLSSLFQGLESQQVPVQFPTSVFNIILEDQSQITEKNISSSNLNIKVFNQDFVKRNIDWEKSAKSILLIAEEKIKEKKELEELKKESENVEDHLQKVNAAINELLGGNSKFLTDAARQIKQQFLTMDTKDTHYFNYNKTKLEECISKHIDNIGNESSVLSNNETLLLTKSAQSDHKPVINKSFAKLSPEVFCKAKERIDSLLERNIFAKSIERLKNYPDIQAWVSDGLRLHNKHNSISCEFCGAILMEKRKDELERHFSNDFIQLKDSLTKAVIWLDEKKIKLDILPLEESFFPELKSQYKELCVEVSKASAQINNEITEWQNILNSKNINPFEKDLSILNIRGKSITNYNDIIDKINNLIINHDKKSNDFENEIQNCRKKLELHYAAIEVREYGYLEKQKELNVLKISVENTKMKLSELKGKIYKIESELSNETLGAQKFNEALSKFLGRHEISLYFDKDLKGYKIVRENSDAHAKYLSEGEKTAIAFVYFITKLKENGSDIHDTIIVVDDPVSSFDSNHLFSAFSFLRTHCQNSKQLFVLTHNFTFFKLLRDWILKKNESHKKRYNEYKPKKAKKVTDKMETKSKVYCLETTRTGSRKSVLKSAPDSLLKYNSEYHYLFTRLYYYKKNETLNIDEAFLTANLSRKLLESFLSFKYPKHRDNFRELVVKGINDEEALERIYRFINKYSHNADIPITEESSENLIGESGDIISEIFEWIEKIDKTHYREMIEVIMN